MDLALEDDAGVADEDDFGATADEDTGALPEPHCPREPIFLRRNSPESPALPSNRRWTAALVKGKYNAYRIVSTAVHTMEDVEYTLKAFKEIKAKLDAGAYDGDDIAAMTVK